MMQQQGGGGAPTARVVPGPGGQPSRNIQQRHGPTLPAFELLHELVEQPGVLDVFGYSEEQVATTVARSFFSGDLWVHGAWPHVSPTPGHIANGPGPIGAHRRRRPHFCSRCFFSCCAGDFYCWP